MDTYFSFPSPLISEPDCKNAEGSEGRRRSLKEGEAVVRFVRVRNQIEESSGSIVRPNDDRNKRWSA
jgi:hypothetical protein